MAGGMIFERQSARGVLQKMAGPLPSNVAALVRCVQQSRALFQGGWLEGSGCCSGGRALSKVLDRSVKPKV